MGLTATVQNAIEKAFIACGDLMDSYTVARVAISYDPSTGTSTETATSFVAAGFVNADNAAFTNFTVIESDQFRVWLKCSDEPKAGDRLTNSSGETHNIIAVKSIKPAATAFLYEVVVK